MKTWVQAIRNERGVALPMALIALVSLTGFVLVFLSMGGMEPRISANLSDAARAHFLADAGVEYAFDILAGSTDWSVQLKGPDNVSGNADDFQIASGMALPGLTSASGTFTVTIRNDNQAGDTALTGQAALDTGDNWTDNNKIVIMTATGTYNGVSRQIQVVMTRLNLNINGGVALPGLGTNTTFSGNSFSITGNDTNLNGSAGSCPSIWGVSVGDAATELLVQSSLSAQQKDNVTGKKQVVTSPGEGDNTIAPDTSLTPAAISKFVNAVKPYANMSLNASSTQQLHYNNLGDTCSTDWNSSNCWGTTSNPKIVYVKGTIDPAQLFYALTITGTSTGSGILIIEDGDLSVGGNFRWEGLILITGQYTGLRYGGGGNQAVYGGVVVNETAAINTQVEVDASGNANIYYSCQALNNTMNNNRKLLSLTSWKEL